MSTIYILGSGAVGFPLGGFLSLAGKDVVAVRTSPDLSAQRGGEVDVGVEYAQDGWVNTTIRTMALSQLSWGAQGVFVICAKAFANEELAKVLADKQVRGPLVILQNGLGVERPYMELLPKHTLVRGVLYMTSQRRDQQSHVFYFRAIQASRLGLMQGEREDLDGVVDALNTAWFPFEMEEDIRREVWRKAIVNSVFNSICPLLEVDNGYFSRDLGGLGLAHEMVEECVALTRRLGIDLTSKDVMQQILRISSGSTQWISTLQDIKRGRMTEIESLNLAIAREAASLMPPLPVTKVEWLGRMVLAKSQLQRAASNPESFSTCH